MINGNSYDDDYATGTHYNYKEQERDKKGAVYRQAASSEDDKKRKKEEVTDFQNFSR